MSAGPAMQELSLYWRQAQSIWSPYLRLPLPLCCQSAAELQKWSLQGHLAQFLLDQQLIVLNGPELSKRGLLDYLPAILAHEIGHQLCFPGSAELHGRMLARAFVALQTEAQHSQLVVNLWQDLLINTRLQLDKQLNLQPLILALRPAEAQPFWNWVLRIYEIRWRLPRLSLCWQMPDDIAEAEAMLAARLIQPTGRHLLRALDAFARLCRKHLPPLTPEVPWLDLPQQASVLPAGLSQLGETASETEEDLITASAEQHSATRSQGQQLEPPAYAQVLSWSGLKLDQQAWLAQYYREQAWPWLLPELSDELPRQDVVSPEGMRPWELDRPVGDIDWTASLVQSPVVVPGMTLLRRRQANEQDSSRRRRHEALDLYLDVSGSVPDPAQSCSPLVLAATILTLSALRLKLSVRITCFSAQEQLLSTPFLQQEAPLMQALLSYHGGATSFPLPLLQQRYSGPASQGLQLVILSDEGWPSLLLQAPDGQSGQTILQQALKQAAGGSLILDLLSPESEALTPPELEPLLAQGWRLLKLQAGQYQRLSEIFG